MKEISTLIVWLSLIYANCFMFLSGLEGFPKYHGFLIWGCTLIVNITYVILED